MYLFFGGFSRTRPSAPVAHIIADRSVRITESLVSSSLRGTPPSPQPTTNNQQPPD
ncbi:unnamed protein product [Pylaiella littoralis]